MRRVLVLLVFVLCSPVLADDREVAEIIGIDPDNIEEPIRPDKETERLYKFEIEAFAAVPFNSSGLKPGLGWVFYRRDTHRWSLSLDAADNFAGVALGYKLLRVLKLRISIGPGYDFKRSDFTGYVKIGVIKF